MISQRTSLALLLLLGGAATTGSHRRHLMSVDRSRMPRTGSTTTFVDAHAVAVGDGGVAARALSSSSERLPVELASLRLGRVDNFPLGRDRDRDDDAGAEWFDYGLLQLMAFGYDYSTPAFRRAREIDPNFAIAYAFEALSCCFWPLWGRDDVAAANEILDLMESNNVTVVDDERGEKMSYVGAIRAHFDESIEDPTDRHALAVEELARVCNARPDDPTAWALLGLWRLSLSSELPNDNKDVGDGEGKSSPSSRMAKLTEGDLKTSLAIQPDHPGALHYSLHLYDHIDSTVHSKGLHAAGLYPKVAPDASHGQHMPVHILLRSGDFARSFDADTLALDAADKTCRLYGRSGDEGCDLWNLYHSLEYLQVEGYHCGRWDEALCMFDRMDEAYRSAERKGLTEAKDLKLFWMRMRAREVLEKGLIDGTLLSSFGFAGKDKDLARVRGQIECPPQVEPLDAGFWSSHTESGYLLARGLCLLLVDDHNTDEEEHEEEESGGGPSTIGDSVDEIVTRMEQISDDYEAAGSIDRTERYNALVHSVHLSLIKAVRHFVDATGARDGYDDGAGDGEAVEDEDRDASKLGDHGESLRLFGEAMSDATAAEDGLREAWTVSVPTVLFLSAHELHGQLLLLLPPPLNDRDYSSTSEPDAVVRRAEAAMEEFRAAERERGPRLTTALGMARAASSVAASPSSSSSSSGPDGGSDGDGNGPLASSSSRSHYHRAWEMMHVENDGAALPFWDEVTSALGVHGGEVTGGGEGEAERGGGGDEDRGVVDEVAAAGNVRGSGTVGPQSSSSSSSRVVLASWAVGSACGAALFVAARAFYRRHGDGGEQRLGWARRRRAGGAT